jgi:hypothetical protein
MGEFYKMEFDAWDEGTVELSLEEEAAYLRVCHQIYRRRGPIPNSEALLCSLWRCHKNKVRSLLQRLISAGKVQVNPEGYLSNTRATQELHHRETLSTRRAYAGRVGGTRSGEVRRKPLESSNVIEAFASVPRTRGEERREEERRVDAAPAASNINIKAPDAELFAKGRDLLGKSAGGLIKRLLDSKGGNVPLAMAALLQASTKENPREYLGGVINRKSTAPAGREPDRPGMVWGDDYM